MMRRPLVVAASIGAAILALAAVIGWSLRFRIATGVVDRRLAAAQVPASYRLTRIGPFLERLEDVRIGDPAAPDLVARRIDVILGYGLAGPAVRGIAIDGVRLRAAIDAGGLHLGAIDRLLPKGRGGGVEPPDLALRLDDVVVALATPNGAVRVGLAGRGNPATRFAGRAEVAAPTLRLAACRLDRVTAAMAVTVTAKRPAAEGPVAIAATTCPGLALMAGVTRIAAASNPAFDRVAVRAGLDGFGGRAGPVRFARLDGTIAASGALGDLRARGVIGADGLSVPGAGPWLRQSAAALAATPFGPVAARGGAAFARMLGGARARIAVAAAIAGRQVAVDLRRLDLRRGDGWARLTPAGGLQWRGGGWRADGDLAIGGGDLPTVALALRQPAAGAPLALGGRLAPYRAGNARLAIPAFRARWDGQAAIVDGIVRLDGPIGTSGFVTGLDLPVAARIDRGAVALVRGCRAIGFTSLAIASFRFDGTRLPVCGAAGTAGFDLAVAPLRLTGHGDGGAPVMVAADRLHVDARGFQADRLTAAIGAPDRRTGLAIATLDGGFAGLSGRFAGLDGAIANVPIAMSAGAGDWRFAGGRLVVAGRLQVADAAPSPRFLPLIAEAAALELAGNRIRATARLDQPQRKQTIATLALVHDLAAGQGHATLDVPGITFVPKGLQPELLTPLTLGVIANVAGTVRGEGRIDWGAAGVGSRGSFATDRLDLAAAFGPVSGVAGRIDFTDLLGLVSAPHQKATIAEINPGVAVADGIVHFQLVGQNRLRIEEAHWPFAGGALRLDPALIDFGADVERRLTFGIERLDAARFVQQLDFPNIAATGSFDGRLPMVFDSRGGRIEGGAIVARPGGGTIAYVGALTTAQIGTMGKLPFDALKAIRYSALDISLDGRLDGEMVSQVRFTGVREATPDRSLVTRLIRNLPFRFNIRIRAPFRGLVGSARAYADPRLLLGQARPATPAEPAVQSRASGPTP